MRHHVLITLALFLLPALPLCAADARSEIDRGVKLHDAGDYDGAIKAYLSALAIEPGNAEAIYELAHTYFTKGDNERCLSAAKQGLMLTSPFTAQFHAVAGNCHSNSGDSASAIRSFEQGLAISPDSPLLHFNLAIDLVHVGRRDDAKRHLESAISSDPAYPSPYYVLGTLHGEDGDRARSLFYLTRFVLLEPNTGRSVQAASSALAIFSSGIEVKPDGNVDVTIPTLDEDDPMSVVEMSISLVGIGIVKPEEDNTDSAAALHVGAFTSLLQITSELSDADLEALRATAAWKHAIAPVLSIHAKGASDTLGYVLALRAGLDGAREWITENGARIEELEKLLKK